jgi:hypothetical protein
MLAAVHECVLGLRVSYLVAISFHCEFEGFETVVLRQVGHEGPEGVWIGCRISQDLLQGGQPNAR